MDAGFIRRALVRHLGWYNSLLIPEFSIGDVTRAGETIFGSDRADLVQVLKSGYAVEYEIKTSYEDWRDDLKKPKWSVGPPTGNEYVSRFFYVVPGRSLVNPTAVRAYGPAIRVPERLPAGAGVLVVMPDGYVHEAAAARRFKVPPLPEPIVRRAMDAFYYRYWRLVRDFEQARDDFRQSLAVRRGTEP